ncbi:alpha/beta fold hydrolase [Sphingobium sp.]|uniref:alpha/beta fold hydrolase n=1 Tax=Sphingobium sp. TaxID=1912891 RepID=UPI002D129F40|nr:alpha/beta fold hydrolase [Sphingobium sp.]HUD91112.1 alpha/beta fold hydrolase [Sphingobium sp.]
MNLNLLGPITLRRDAAVVQLPASRKTRALLGYLAAMDKPVRREQLTSLFWEVPDDPRGALRWSLSKLRPLVDEQGRCRLEADRDSVRLNCSELQVDWFVLRDLAASDVPNQSVETMTEALAEGEFMEGLDLPDCETFHGWLIAMREDSRRSQVVLLRELVGRDLAEPRALAFARRWCKLDPYDPIAWTSLIDRLERAGRRNEADEQRAAARRTMEGLNPPAVFDLPQRKQAGQLALSEGECDLPLQQIRFCTARDGTGLAYSVLGDGPPLVKTANWLNHLEHDWDSPVWRHWIRHFGAYRKLIRYDERGNGLSDWDTAEISFEAFVDDLACVVDAAHLDRFDLLGISQGCSVAIAYAVRNPQRVRKLILYGGYASGWKIRGSSEEIETREAMITLTRTGWGRNNPAFRQLFSSLFFPDALPAEVEWFNELQRVSASPENAVRLQLAFGMVDVRGYLDQVRAPTLVLHSNLDAVVPFACGRTLAATIPDARFVQLESRNHLLLEHEPAWPKASEAIKSFLD